MMLTTTYTYYRTVAQGVPTLVWCSAGFVTLCTTHGAGIPDNEPAISAYEYEREGVVNLFGCCEPLAGQRWVDVTAQRTRRDWAQQIQSSWWTCAIPTPSASC